MKDLQYYFQLALDDLDAIGVPYNHIEECTINTRAKHRYGQCKIRNDKYYINISERLLEDYVPTKSLLCVLYHEILHTIDGCFNHGKEWKEWAELVNDCYAVNITTTSSDKKYGLKPVEGTQRKSMPYRYEVECCLCGAYGRYKTKRSWFTQEGLESCTCKRCGNQSSFELWDLKTGRTLINTDINY